MSGTAEVFLGIIAAAVAVMAAVQVSLVVAGLRMARRVERLATELDTTVKPLVASLSALTADASRATRVAAVQVERLDRVLADLAARLDQTLTTAQHFIQGPARNGVALVAGVKAAVTVLRSLREASRRRSASRAITFQEEEESLFIG